MVCALGFTLTIAQLPAQSAQAAELPNLVVNGDFEHGTDSWKSGTVWNSSASKVNITEDAHSGKAALQYRGSVTGPGYRKRFK